MKQNRFTYLFVAVIITLAFIITSENTLLNAIILSLLVLFYSLSIIRIIEAPKTEEKKVLNFFSNIFEDKK